MSNFSSIFNELVTELAKLPGIGRRSAERMAFHIMKTPAAQAALLARKIEEITKLVKPCQLCNNFSTADICSICSNPQREKDTICVVEEPKDILAIEKTAHYSGLYYVLLESISPLEGVSEEDVDISRLIERLRSGTIKEVIIATNPDTEGELTAQFLIEKISPFAVKLYRIAIGIPLGTQIEYIDSSTLGKALKDRRAVT